MPRPIAVSKRPRPDSQFFVLSSLDKFNPMTICQHNMKWQFRFGINNMKSSISINQLKLIIYSRRFTVKLYGTYWKLMHICAYLYGNLPITSSYSTFFISQSFIESHLIQINMHNAPTYFHGLATVRAISAGTCCHALTLPIAPFA